MILYGGISVSWHLYKTYDFMGRKTELSATSVYFYVYLCIYNK